MLPPESRRPGLSSSHPPGAGAADLTYNHPTGLEVPHTKHHLSLWILGQAQSPIHGRRTSTGAMAITAHPTAATHALPSKAEDPCPPSRIGCACLGQGFGGCFDRSLPFFITFLEMRPSFSCVAWAGSRMADILSIANLIESCREEAEETPEKPLFTPGDIGPTKSKVRWTCCI
jgi:hypothetical protein